MKFILQNCPIQWYGAKLNGAGKTQKGLTTKLMLDALNGFGFGFGWFWFLVPPYITFLHVGRIRHPF